MLKIKVSYTTEEELAEITQLLAPITVRKKISSNQEGKYKKAYFEILSKNELRGKQERTTENIVKRVV